MSWEKVSLGDLCEINMGKTPSRSNPSYWNGNLSWVSIADLKGDRFIYNTKECITEKSVNESGIRKVPINTLLFSFKLSIGKVAITGKEIYTNEAIVALPIIDIKRLDVNYLYWAVQMIDLSGIGDKAVMGLTLNKEKLKKLQIPLPPLPIQKRIAEILDTADALRRKDQELLKKYDELAQAIFIDMFGDPVKNEKGWEVKKLEEVCDRITDGTHFSPPNEDTGIPYITAKHLRQDQIDFFSNPTYINIKNHSEIYSRCNPVKGDVLYIKDGATTGVAAVNEYEFEFSMLSSLALIKPNRMKLNSYYLSSYLNNSIVKQELIRSYMAGAAIKRFTLDKINKFEIVLPSIQQQNEYELRWRKLQESVKLVKNSKSSLLFNSLIQKAFNGELVN